MSLQNVYIENYSLVSSLGLGKKKSYQALEKNSLGFLRSLTQFRADGASLHLGQVNIALDNLSQQSLEQQSRCNQLLWSVWKELEADFLQATASINPLRIGVIVGTSTSGIAEGEGICKNTEDVVYERQQMACPAQSLANWAGAKGPVLAISTACTSGAKALASARRWLSSHYCDVVLVAGVDSLCELTVNGFSALESVSESTCTPFGKNRSGINIGEGAGLFILSREPSGLCLSGVGESSDAHHISAPDPTAAGAINAIEIALQDAKLKANDIDYINAHGTATQKNDAMESLAVNKVFGDQVPVSSTKPLTGHTLGAAGAIEAALCCLLLENKNLPLPINYYGDGVDETLPAINLVSANNQLNLERTHIMSHSFAFGGNNIALVLSSCSEVS